MDFLKKRLKRLTSMGLALLLSASAFPATAFAASDSTSTRSGGSFALRTSFENARRGKKKKEAVK